MGYRSTSIPASYLVAKKIHGSIWSIENFPRLKDYKFLDLLQKQLYGQYWLFKEHCRQDIRHKATSICQAVCTWCTKPFYSSWHSLCIPIQTMKKRFTHKTCKYLSISYTYIIIYMYMYMIYKRLWIDLNHSSLFIGHRRKVFFDGVVGWTRACL